MKAVNFPWKEGRRFVAQASEIAQVILASPPKVDDQAIFDDLIERASDRRIFERVDSIVANRLSIESRDGSLCTPLMRACEDGRHAVAKKLIDAGAPLESTDPSGCTALFYCIQRGHIDAARVLLTAGASVNNRCDEGQSVLDVAADDGTNGLCALLIEHGAIVDVANKRSQTPLLKAAIRGNLDAARELVEAGASVSQVTPVSGMAGGKTALHLCAEGQTERHIDLAIFLIQAGCPSEAVSAGGMTAMQEARDRYNGAWCAQVQSAIDSRNAMKAMDSIESLAGMAISHAALARAMSRRP